MNPLFYVLNVLLLVGLIWIISKQHWAKKLQPFFVPALLLKLLCGVLLGLIYHHYYGEGDTITYFRGSLKLTAHAHDNPAAYARLILFNEFESEQFRKTILFSALPGFSNSFFLLKCISLLNLVTGSSYYLNALYFSVFSFWGIAKLTAILAAVYPTTKKAAVLAFLFFPSVVFWSSGILKDAVMMGSMCWVVAFILQVSHRYRVNLFEIVLIPLMLYLFVRIKLFFSAALLLFLIGYLVVKLLVRLKPVLQPIRSQIILYVGLIGVAGLAAVQLVSFYSLDFIIEQLVYSYEGMRALSAHVPHIEYPNLKPTISSVAAHSPIALFNSFFKPVIGESFSPLYLLAGFENLILLLLIVLSGASLIRKNEGSRFHLLHLAFVFFIIIMAIVIGISTPNFGTLIRYRIVFLPFLVYMLLQSFYAKRLLARLGIM